MAAPSYVKASDGATDNGGAWSYTGPAPGAAGNLLILQVVEDGTGTETISVSSITNCNDLAGSSGMTLVTGSPFAIGSPQSAKQWLWIGRATSTNAPVVTGGNTGTNDVYVRMYEFSGVHTGTTLADVIENSTAGNAVNAAGTSTSVADTGVTTTGVDRLACNFIGVDDEVAATELTAMSGATGGTWAYPIAAYGTATGTDASLALVTATIASAGTINGASDAITSQGWGVVGFALKPPAANTSCVPSAASLTLTGATPTVTKTDNVLAVPGAASLSLTGATPPVIVGFAAIDGYLLEDASGHYQLESGAGALLGEWGGPQVFTPAAAGLFLTGATPAVAVPEGADPNHLNAYRRGEPYPYIRGAVAGTGFEYWRRTAPLANADPPENLSVVALPPAASLTLAGAPSATNVGIFAVPDAATALVLTGAVPVIGDAAIPTAASLTLTGAIPVIGASAIPTEATLTLQGAVPVIAEVIATSPASLTLTGDTPLVAAGGSQTRVPDAASLTLTGATPAVNTGANVISEPTAASLSLTGAVPVIAASAIPTAGTLTLSGATPIVEAIGSQTRVPDAASLILTGDTPLVVAGGSQSRQPSVAGLTLEGAVPFVSAGGAGVAEPTPASLALTGATPIVAVTANVVSLPTAASLSLAGAIPQIAASALPAPASLTLTGATPQVATPVVAAPTAAALVVSGATPTVVAGGSQSRQPTAASLTVTGAVPFVSAGGAGVSEPTPAALTLTGSVPVVFAGATVEVLPTQAALTLAGGTPQVRTPVVSLPTAASLTLTADTPIVAKTDNVYLFPSGAPLVLEGAVPYVFAANPAVSEPTPGTLTLLGGTPPVVVASALARHVGIDVTREDETTGSISGHGTGGSITRTDELTGDVAA